MASCPGHGAACNAAPLSRDPGPLAILVRWAPVLQRITNVLRGPRGTRAMAIKRSGEDERIMVPLRTRVSNP